MRVVPLLLLVSCIDRHGDSCDTGCEGDADTDADSDADGDSDSDTDTDAIVVNQDFKLLKSRPKNVIFFSYDTLRRDHVNAMGYTEHETTPTLDKLFEEGVGFYNHRSCSSWTFPSFTCVLTGRDQIDNLFWPYAEAGISGTDLPEAPEDLPLVAKIFHEMGYHTGVYSASGFLGSAAAMDQGMDEGYGQFGSRVTDAEEMKADEVLDDAIEFLDDRLAEPETPFFLHMHFIDPHMPWVPPEEYLGWEEALDPLDQDYFSNSTLTAQMWTDIKDGRFDDDEVELLVAHMRARYDAEIRYADDQTDRFFAYMDANGLWEDTIVVFVSDHGEEFYEHGNFNHGYNSFDEQIRTVAAFYQPGNLVPARVDEMTLHQDLVPTLFAILGTDPSVAPSYQGFTGEVIGTDEPRTWVSNLVFRFSGDPESQNRTHQAVTDGNEKLMYRWDTDGRSTDNGGPKYFYDIGADAGEQDNIYRYHDGDQQPWWDKLCPFIKLIDDDDPNSEVGETPECAQYE